MSTLIGRRLAVAVSCSAALFFLLLGCEAENTVLGTDDGGDDVTDMTDENEPDITPEDGDGDDEPDTDTSPGDGTTDDGGEDDGGSNGDECDLTGTWVVRVWTINEALSLAACANNWYYYEITDNGDTFTVDRGNSCGFEVVGSASVRLSDETVEALLRKSDRSLIGSESVSNATDGRTGVFKPDGEGGCEFSIEQWWAVRGADLARYLPAKEDFATATIDGLEQEDAIPTSEDPEGNEDWENDGNPGITLISQTPQGRRYVTQRDWTKAESYSVSANADEFEVRMQFNNIEGVVGVSGSPLLNLTSLAATPNDVYGHVMTWQKLDDDMPEGSENIESMVDYCLNLQEEVQTRSRALRDDPFSTECCALPEDVEENPSAVPEICKLSRQ
jgi:hypothetical protein